MLRTGLIVASAAAVAIFAILLVMGLMLPGLFVLAAWAMIALVALVFERSRYKRILAAPPGPDWERTEERFVDPATGKTLTVYYRPSTGKREYVG